MVISLAHIETQGLLIGIAEQVEGLQIHICAFDPSLEQAPEVFDAVGVPSAFDIALGWVYFKLRPPLQT